MPDRVVLVRDFPLGALVLDVLVTGSKGERTGEVIVPRDELRRVARELAQVADAQGAPP